MIKPLITKQKDFDIEINFSQDAIDNEIIKIIPKRKGAIEIPASELLHIIATFMKSSALATALTSAEVKELWMTEVERTFHFTADKDYKKGDTTSFNVLQAYPVILAVLEQEWNMLKMKGDKFYAISKAQLTEGMKTLAKKNEKFLRDMYQMGDDTKGLLPEEKKEEAKEETKT